MRTETHVRLYELGSRLLLLTLRLARHLAAGGYDSIVDGAVVEAALWNERGAREHT